MVRGSISAMRTLHDWLARGLEAAGCPAGAAAMVSSSRVIAAAVVGDITFETPVLLGSTSKSVTGLAVRQLAEQGLLELDVPLRAYLPKARVLPNATVREVAQHCSGVRSDSTLARDKSFRYANQNYNYLGQLVEQLSETSFVQYVRRRIAPSAQGSSHFGHTAVFGRWVRTRPFPTEHSSWIQPASGALAMSLRGACAYLQALLTQPVPVLDAVPTGPSPAVAGVFGEEGSYSFGWILKEHAGVRLMVHTGKTPGTTTMFALIPERDLGVVLLVPYADFLVTTPLLEQLSEALIRLALGEEPTLPTVRERRAKRLALFGTYALVLGGAVGVAALSSWLRVLWLGPALAFVCGAALRIVSGTPTLWILRFAPDFFAVAVVAFVVMSSSVLA